MSRCTRCNQKLTAEEAKYYGASCEACERDWLYLQYGGPWWRLWCRIASLWWRRITS